MLFVSRAEKYARFIIDNNTTIRYTAKVFDISKSTVHNDISNRLKIYNESLYLEVQKVLKKNFSEKHIRGGLSTKKKYEK